jgi:hypothetical protein
MFYREGSLASRNDLGLAMSFLMSWRFWVRISPWTPNILTVLLAFFYFFLVNAGVVPPVGHYHFLLNLSK